MSKELTEKVVRDSPKPDEEGDEDDIFQSFEKMLETIPTSDTNSGFMVVDECGDSDEEANKQKVVVKKEKESPKAKKPLPRDPNERIVRRSKDILRRSRSPRRRRTPPRRSPPRHRPTPPRRRPSPPRHRPSVDRGATDRKPKTTGGGAASFLADLKKQLGTFEELEKVEKETESNRPSTRDRDHRSYRGRVKEQQQQLQAPQQQQQQQNYQQFPNMMMNAMPAVNDPMGMMNGMMSGMGLVMPQNMGMMPYQNNMMMGPPGVDPPQMFQPEIGLMPNSYPMMMQPQMMQQQAQMPVSDRKRSRSRDRHSRSPRRGSSRSTGRRNSRSPKRRRSRSQSRDQNHRSSSKDRKYSSRGISQSNSTTNPPIRTTNIDLSEITSQLFLDNKIGLSDYLQTKMSGTPSTNYSRPMDHKLPLTRVISKLKAATHILENKNDIEYNMKFLFVPPKYSSDSKNVAGASPVFPTKQNPLFRTTTDRPDLVSESRPFTIVPVRVTELARLLGLDESVIAKQLESNVVTEEFFETREREAGGQTSNGGGMGRGRMQQQQKTQQQQQEQRWSPVPPPKPKMEDMSTQTPPLCCRRCEDRDRKKVCGVGTQTKPGHQLNETTQTSETDFTLAKLRFKSYDKDFAVHVKNEYTRAREEGSLRLGPPGSSNLLPTRKQEKQYSYRFS